MVSEMEEPEDKVVVVVGVEEEDVVDVVDVVAEEAVEAGDVEVAEGHPSLTQ